MNQKLNKKLFILPILSLGGAAFVLAPAPTSEAFAKLGSSLPESQRDVRVFNNFADVTSNDNVVAASQFPGYTRAELAVWKGAVEWGANLHGDGSGDTTNPLGSGGANFDAMWAGNATGVGSVGHNVVSAVASCSGGGTLAFCESTQSTGWRIRFCDNWVWDDGPAGIGNRWDIQGVMAHEYGHGLGLGHSGGQATMAPSGSAGSTGLRSIHADDISGVQCVYGVASATKPIITATVANTGANTLTIFGSSFGGAGSEVWFTNDSGTATNIDPIVRVTGVTATNGGTVIVVAIPAAAGPGDVMVNKSTSGGATLSNAFPTDLVGTFGTPPFTGPDIVDISPATIDALIPGTDETIVISGNNLDTTTGLTLNGVPIDASRWTIIDPFTITLDMPQSSILGPQDIEATDGVQSSAFTVDIVAPATLQFQFGNGDPLNVVDRSNGVSWIMSGIPGRKHRVFVSLSNIPTVTPHYTLQLGNNGTNLYKLGDHIMPASGWKEVVVPTAQVPDPGLAGTDYYGQTIEVLLPSPFDVSNFQSIHVVR